MVEVMLVRLTLQLVSCTDKGSQKWWSLLRWAVLLLVAVVLVDAKRGRCYASRAALVAQSPVWQGNILLDDDLSEFFDASSARRDDVPDVSWLADKDKDAVRQRGKRAARSRASSSEGREAVVWFVNLVERYNISMQLIGEYGNLKVCLQYGKTRRTRTTVALDDMVNVEEHGPDGSVKENRTQSVKSIYSQLPRHSVWYIVANSHYELTHNNIFDDVNLAIAPIITDSDPSTALRAYPDMTKSDLQRKSTLYIYSTFLTATVPDHGIDVWGMRKDSNSVSGFKLIRFHRKLERYHASSFFVDPGVYEIKVLKHKTLEKSQYNIHTIFKNIRSLIHAPRRFIELKPGEQTMMIIGGQSGGRYKPQLIVLPDHYVQPFDYPKLPIMVFSAYPTEIGQKVQLGFEWSGKRFDTWANLDYKQLEKISVYANGGDRFALGLRQGAHTSSPWGPKSLLLQVENMTGTVPLEGWCALIVLPSSEGFLSHGFQCVEESGHPTPNASWVLAYHGLSSHAGEVDILFKWRGDSRTKPAVDEAVMIDRVRPRQFKVASVKPGLHLVKVVPRGSIDTVSKWDRVNSLVQETCVNVTGQYPQFINLAVIHGGTTLPSRKVPTPKALTMRRNDGLVTNVDMAHCEAVAVCKECATTARIVSAAGSGAVLEAVSASSRPEGLPAMLQVIATVLLLLLLR